MMTDAELIADTRELAEISGWHDELIRLADALAAHQWRPIETVPRGCNVLITDGGVVWSARLPEGTLRVGTHWMPLPTPPKKNP